jgi:DNA-binding transcriptional ArsR family regulator
MVAGASPSAGAKCPRKRGHCCFVQDVDLSTHPNKQSSSGRSSYTALGRRATCGRVPAGIDAQQPYHDLTSIYLYKYIKDVESSFAIIAEPNRRDILSLLASSERSVGEIERRLRMPQTSVSKHLRVLREAGFVESRIEAQRRIYRIRPKPLKEIDAWRAPFRKFWTNHVDALERHLDRMAQAQTKGKAR